MKIVLRQALLSVTGFLCTCLLYSQCGPAINTFPYMEGFEAGPAWTSGGVNSDWAWGTPAHPYINSAGGGARSWCIGGLTGSYYNGNQQSWLMSPCFDFTNLPYPWISFKIFWESERQWEGMQLQYSLNGGSTWARVGSFGDPVDCLNQNWYNINNVSYLNLAAAGTRHAWSGRIGPTSGSCAGGSGSGGWVTATHCISNLAGQPSVRFRFIFGSGSTCNNYDGIAIDDILIQNAAPNNAGFSFACTGINTISFTNQSALCPNSFQWNFGDPASGNANTSVLANPTHIFTAPGTYNVSLTVNGPCNAPSTIVIPVTVAGVSASHINITCHGAADGVAIATATNGTGPFNFSWNTNPVQTTPVATGLTPGTYTVTMTDSSNCPASATVTITEPPVLAASISASTNATCGLSNASATVTATGGAGSYTYSWSPSGGSGATASSLAPGIYICTVTDTNGCTDTAQVNLANVPLGVLTASNTGPYCTGSNIQMNVSGGTGGYTWSGPNSYNSTAQNPAIPNATVSMGGTYTVMGVDVNNCPVSASTNVIIHQPPTAAASNTGPYCSGGTIQLNASGGTGYTWNGPQSYSATVQNPAVNNAAPAMSGTYSVIVTDANGCTDTALTIVTVHPLPTATAGNSGPVCEGNNVNLTSGGGTGYAWNGPAGFVSNAQNPALHSVTAAQSGVYTVIVTDTHNCSATVTTTLVVNPLPSVTAGSNAPVCAGNSISLNASGAVSYNWTGPAGFTATTQNPVIAAANPATHNGTYIVTGTDAAGCSRTDSIQLIISHIPTAGFTGSSLVGCIPHCASLNDISTVTGSAIQAWEWTVEGQSPLTDQHSNICLYAAGTYDVTLVVTSSEGCRDTAFISDFIHVSAGPESSFEFSPNPVFISNPTVSFTNTSAGNITDYFWNIGEGYTSTSENPSYTFSSDTGQHCISLMVTDNLGCKDTSTQCLTVLPEFSVYIPNAFTPNRDPHNPLFTVYGKGIEKLDAQIYNRWGQMIYRFKHTDMGWAGILPDGSECPAGVYNYRVIVTDAQGISHDYTGQINLIR